MSPPSQAPDPHGEMDATGNAASAPGNVAAAEGGADASASSGAKASSGPNLHQPAIHAALARYWRANVRIMIVLLVIWAIVGLGCGVLFADALNNYSIGGFPLGFWFAQQGSIIVFVLLILVYCVLLNWLDRRHHKELERLKRGGKA